VSFPSGLAATIQHRYLVINNDPTMVYRHRNNSNTGFRLRREEMKKPEYKPRPVLIRIRATQKEVNARPVSNGWALANGDFVHNSAAKLVKVLEEA